MKKIDVVIGLIVALVIAGVLFHFSSDLPDAVQWILKSKNQSPPKLILGIPKTVAAILGVGITFVLAFGLGKLISSKKNTNENK